MAKLTNREAESLIKLRDHGPRTVWPDMSRQTLDTLEAHGLARSDGWEWSITEAGRQALSEGEQA